MARLNVLKLTINRGHPARISPPELRPPTTVENFSLTRTFQANLFAPSSTLNPVGRKKTVFSVWERTGRDWMAAAWAVVQPLVGVFVGGSTGADYLGGNCLPRLGMMIIRAARYLDGVRFYCVDIRTRLFMIVRSLKPDFLPTTLALHCADFVAIGNR